MANLSEDIQCAGFDTSPPMLDRTDFKSWQQRICLYCLGKDNGVNILKSINEGPFKIGKFREINFSEVHLSEDQKKNGIEIFADLTPEEKRDKIEVRGIMLGEQLQLEIRELKTELAILILNGIVLDEEQLLFIAAGQTNTFDDDVDEAPVQDLALNEDNIFQADQCDAFDSDVDEAPTA
ncbi:hypothetical protein Tco_1313882 [Tanacetum coccineum]